CQRAYQGQRGGQKAGAAQPGPPPAPVPAAAGVVVVHVVLLFRRGRSRLCPLLYGVGGCGNVSAPGRPGGPAGRFRHRPPPRAGAGGGFGGGPSARPRAGWGGCSCPPATAAAGVGAERPALAWLVVLAGLVRGLEPRVVRLQVAARLGLERDPALGVGVGE